MEPTLIINAALTFEFEDKVAKLNRRADKLGMPHVQFDYGASFERGADRETFGSYIVQDENGKDRRVALYREVFLTGDAPVVEGWQFIATVDHKGAKPIVNRQPYTATDVDLSAFEHRSNTCDHCGFTRNRNDVLVLRNVATGETMQLGRNCAADFFRSKDASGILSVSDWLSQVSDLSERSPRAEPYMTVQRLFETAAAVVRTFGWVNHKDVEFDNTVQSTRARTWANLFPWAEMKREDRVTITDEDREEARVLIEWADRKFFSVEDGNEFERKVQACVENWNGTLMVRQKYLNMLIWMIGGYKRDLQKEATERMKRAARAKQAAGSQHVGTVGTRTEFELGVEFKRAFDGQYGIRYMIKMTDADGNVFVWWGTNEFAADLKVGDKVRCKATVKAHDEYEGCAQTVLTRLTGEVLECA